jgi:hypothetical protein
VASVGEIREGWNAIFGDNDSELGKLRSQVMRASVQLMDVVGEVEVTALQATKLTEQSSAQARDNAIGSLAAASAQLRAMVDQCRQDVMATFDEAARHAQEYNNILQ